MKKTVVIGMSGGVDSSVAALLLKEQGYNVIGLYMNNWEEQDECGACTGEEDFADVRRVGNALGIPYYSVNFAKEYMDRVFSYFLAEYKAGRTPNPDVHCNREIKFDAFLKKALELGAERVATGHYCRCVESLDDKGNKHYQLLAGADPNKDQSYFLCQLTQEQLSYAMFPIGDLLKPEVRRIAEEQKLATAKRKDSQGICFVGKVDLPVFLQQQLKAKEGNIHEILPHSPRFVRNIAEDDHIGHEVPYRLTVRDGKKIGTHQGAHFYTIGQRKGLGIGGRKESLFIIGTDVNENVIYVGEGDTHPGLYRKALRIRNEEIHWVDNKDSMSVGERRRYDVRIRYRQPLQKATLIMEEEHLYILFDEPQRGIAAGQFAAWYSGDIVVGSGVIER